MSNSPDFKDDDIRLMTDTRRQDLYVGAVIAKDPATNKDVLVPLFTVVVHNANFFQAIKENLADVPVNNGWEILIGPDASSLEKAIAEKIINLEEYRPTYTIKVQTKAKQGVEFYDDQLEPLGKNSKDDGASEEAKVELKASIPAKSVEVATYHFISDKFDSNSVHKFVKALQQTKFWMLTIVKANPNGGWMDSEEELRFQSELGAISLHSENRERRRRPKK